MSLYPLNRCKNMSRLDRLYRQLILTGFFKKGWGDPTHIKDLLQFRLTLGDPTSTHAVEITEKLLTKVNVKIEKETKHGNLTAYEASFTSPLDTIHPHLLADECRTARFQVVYDSKVFAPNSPNPIVLHLAGTGDHGFLRRRIFQSYPLLKNHGINSAILENPFYGCRKPKDQLRSSVHHVNDVFVMGAALILESCVILNWLLKVGFGPTLCITGISMGGFMASLAAGFWRQSPIAVVPCLSWSSAAPVFTQGVLSEALPWKRLSNQFHTDPVYRELNRAICRGDYGAKYIGGQNGFSAPVFFDEDSSEESTNMSNFGSPTSTAAATAIEQNPAASINFSRRYSTASGKNPGAFPWKRRKRKEEDGESREFMTNLMDQFTHLGNYSSPLDPSLTSFLVATNDAYVPFRADSTRATAAHDMREVWRGCSATELDGYGHVGAYVLKQRKYLNVISDTMKKLEDKHFLGQ